MPPNPDLEHLAAANGSARDPILFVHGAYGTPWMWLQHYMPWFASRGHDVFAVRLRDAVAGSIEPGLDDYLRDLESAAASIGRPAVTVAHSLGALVAQMALGRIDMRALALLAPVPPTGMLWSSMRLALSEPGMWARTAMSGADAGFADERATREALFTDDTHDTVVAETHANLRPQPSRPLMEAQWPRYIQSADQLRVPIMTLAAGCDRLIPVDVVESTARHHGARHTTVDGIGHALMLDTDWQLGAAVLGDWIQEIGE